MGKFANNLSHSLSKNSPAILLGLSLAGLLATAYLTHKAAQKALKTIQFAEKDGPSLDFKQKVKLVWPYYMPPLLSCGATVAFMISGNAIHYRKQAAIVTAVSLSEKALNEYQDKMVETLGKNKERKAVDEIIQSKVAKAEKEGKFTQLVSPNTERQEVYVFDTFSGRPFVSTIEKVHRAANEVARECINHDCASLNLFYSKVGLSAIPVGDEMGWNNAYPMEIDTTSAIVNDDRALIAINYVNKPKISYDDPWT